MANHDDSEWGIADDVHPGVFVRSVYFQDPDGILLEFACWTRRAPVADDVAHRAGPGRRPVDGLSGPCPACARCPGPRPRRRSSPLMYDFIFDDRDPVAEPGTATGSPGDWWTVFALVPDVLEHAVQGFGLYQSPKRRLTPVSASWPRPGRAGRRGASSSSPSTASRSASLGVDEAMIEAVPHWAAAACFDETERLVLAYTDCLVLDRGRVPDGLFDALRAQLGDEEILELTYIGALYLQHAVMSRALRTEFDDRPEPVVEVAGPGGRLDPDPPEPR